MNRWDFENYKQQTAGRLLGMIDQEKAKSIAAQDKARAISRQNTLDAQNTEAFAEKKAGWEHAQALEPFMDATKKASLIFNTTKTAPDVKSYNGFKAGLVNAGVVKPEDMPDFKTDQELMDYQTKDIRARYGILGQYKNAGKTQPQPKPMAIQDSNGNPAFGQYDPATKSFVPVAGGNPLAKSTENTNLQTIQVNDPNGKVDALGMPIKVPAVFNRKTGEATLLNVSPAKAATPAIGNTPAAIPAKTGATTTPGRRVGINKKTGNVVYQKPDGTYVE